MSTRDSWAPAPRRHRRPVAIAATAALIGAPLLAGALAGAATPAAASGPETPAVITFHGGCGLLGIGSKSSPDAVAATVAAGSDLRFANRLGQPATLWLNGEAGATVAAGDSTDLTFHTGPVVVSMQISCLLGKPAGTVTVEVVPSYEASPAPPPSGGPGAGTPEGGGPGSAGAPGAGSSTAPAPAGSGGSEGGSPATGAQGGAGSPGAAAPGPGGTPGGGADAGDWSTGGTPGGAQFDSPGDGPMSTPGDGRPGADGSGDLEGTATVNPPDVDRSAELTPAAQSQSGDGAVGLLALIATVCLVGSSAGAIRVLISRRANPAKWA